MRKKYINGSSQFRFRLHYPDNSDVILDFSMHYKSLTVYENPTSIRHRFLDGSKLKKNLFFDYEFLLDYSEYLELNDALKIQQIKNAEFQDGVKIYITPHIDVPELEYEVITVDEKRQLGVYYKEANKDYFLRFETVNSFNIYDWKDPNTPPIIVAESFLEF